MSLLRKAFRFIVDSVLFLLIIALAPGLPPYHPRGSYPSIELEPELARKGGLAPNTRLDATVRLFEDSFRAPESVASRGRDNEIFVSMHGGSIVKVHGPGYDRYIEIVKIGPGCRGVWEESVCGRPLGLRFARDGKLLVADAYLGIFKVDVDTGDKERLLDPSKPVNGARPRLIDDLDEDSEGNIYWSDASSVAGLDEGVLEGILGQTGRLVKLDVNTGQNMVLIDKVTFANGVQLSPDEDFVLVCETWVSRVLRYWLRGPLAGTTDVFVAGLPGYPDNIRAKPDGGYYVSLVVVKDPNGVDLTRVTNPLPLVRRLVARLLYATKKMFDGLTYLYDNEYTPQIAYRILHTGTMSSMMTGNRSMVVTLAADGTVDGCLEGTTGAVIHISETTQVNDKLFFGSPYNHYLGMLDLAKEDTTAQGTKEKADDTIKKSEENSKKADKSKKESGDNAKKTENAKKKKQEL